MNRRNFLKYNAALGVAATIDFFIPKRSLAIDSYDQFLIDQQRSGALRPVEQEFLFTDYIIPSGNKTSYTIPKNTPEVGLWFYCGFQRNETFEHNLDVLARRVGDRYAVNSRSLDLLVKNGINTVYLGGTDAYLQYNSLDGFGSLEDRRKEWARPKQIIKMYEAFSAACADRNIEVAVLGYEDTCFLEWKDSKLKNYFSALIGQTGHIARKYQIDLEPHAMDLKGNFFRNNPQSRSKLLKRYLQICDMFYNIADKNGKLFMPAVPLIDTPSVSASNSMNYHSILKLEGYEGINAIPSHSLILMSYTWDAEELYDMCYSGGGKINDIKIPFLLAASNFPNSWDPYFESGKEFAKVPTVISSLQKKNPNLGGHLNFCNLSLMENLTNIKYSDRIPVSADREYLKKISKGVK